MILSTQPHNLLILSQQFEIYKQLIEEESLPGLNVTAVDSINNARQDFFVFDIVFGEPSLVIGVLDRLPKLHWVQSTWAGIEPFLGPGKRTDYLLTNIRNVYGQLMSEYVFGYLLAIERKILTRLKSQQARKWEPGSNGTLKGKILGLVGVGSIGAHIASTAKHFGMHVQGYTRQSEDCESVDQYFHGGELKEFAQNLDYIVCTLPGTSATNNLIDSDILSALPAKAWLINIGRGSTLDELGVASALNRKVISGAILDVFKEEPLPPDHPLWSTPNTFITSHSAGQNYPPDIAAIFIENYMRLLRNESLRYIVDFNLGY